MTRRPRTRPATLALLLGWVGGVGGVGLATLGAPAPAAASKPRLRLERLDGSRLGEGKLGVYASVVELEGTVVEGLAPAAFTLLIDGKPAGKAAAAQRFSATGEEVDVAFVVETAAQYRQALEPVKAALRDFLEDQPPRFKAMLIAYGSETETKSRLVPAAALADPLDDLAADDDGSDVRLVEAVQAAMTELNRIQPRPGQPPPRRLIVLISDGLNARMDRQTFRNLGDQARKNHLPIHALAFSPGDERGPLLNLGELAKRSNGTFRWAPRQDDLKAQLDTLADEVRKQYVLSFDTSIAGLDHLFQLRQGELSSNRFNGALGTTELGAGAARGGAAGWRWWMWLLLALGVLVALYLVGLWLQARGVVPAPAAAPRPRTNAPSLLLPPQPRQPPPRDAPRPALRPAAPVAPQAARRAELLALGGALAGTRLEIRGALTVGKAGQAVTIADDPTVSSRHCEFFAEGGGFFVRDLGSTNGTFVNNQRLAGQPAQRRLADGDVVRLGAQTQFKIRME